MNNGILRMFNSNFVLLVTQVSDLDFEVEFIV